MKNKKLAFKMQYMTTQYFDAQVILERNITTYFLFTVKRPVDHNKTELSACHFL